MPLGFLGNLGRLASATCGPVWNVRHGFVRPARGTKTTSVPSSTSSSSLPSPRTLPRAPLPRRRSGHLCGHSNHSAWPRLVSVPRPAPSPRARGCPRIHSDAESCRVLRERSGACGAVRVERCVRKMQTQMDVVRERGGREHVGNGGAHLGRRGGGRRNVTKRVERVWAQAVRVPCMRSDKAPVT